jgi:hypothetical protein
MRVLAFILATLLLTPLLCQSAHASCVEESRSQSVSEGQALQPAPAACQSTDASARLPQAWPDAPELGGLKANPASNGVAHLVEHRQVAELSAALLSNQPDQSARQPRLLRVVRASNILPRAPQALRDEPIAPVLVRWARANLAHV